MVEIVAKGPVKSRQKKGWAAWYVSTRHRDIKKIAGEKGELIWFRNREDAEQKARELNAAQYTNGVVTRSAAGTLESAYKIYIASLEERAERKTLSWEYLRKIKSNLKRPIECLGKNTKVSEITKDKITDYIAGDPRSRLVRQHVLNYLSAVFEQAIELKWIAYNPAAKVRIEGQRVFTETEIVEDVGYNFDFAECERIIQGLIKYDTQDDYLPSQLRECARRHPCKPQGWCNGLAVITIATTGLRTQEIAALRWSAIDFEHDRLLVLTAKKRGKDGVSFIGNVKSKKGRRAVLLGALSKLLKEWRLRSPFASDDDFVFPNHVGDFKTNYEVWNRTIKRVLEIENIERHFTAYTFRHVYATLLAHATQNDFVKVADRLGHTNINFSRSVYCERLDDATKNAENEVADSILNTNNAKDTIVVEGKVYQLRS